MNSLKHLITLVILSVIIVMAGSFISMLLSYYVSLHALLMNTLNQVFTQSQAGAIISGTLSILVISLVIPGIIAGIYWCFKRQLLPYIWLYVWGFWLVLATILVNG